jgi:hypothetical protein
MSDHRFVRRPSPRTLDDRGAAGRPFLLALGEGKRILTRCQDDIFRISFRYEPDIWQKSKRASE